MYRPSLPSSLQYSVGLNFALSSLPESQISLGLDRYTKKTRKKKPNPKRHHRYHFVSVNLSTITTTTFSPSHSLGNHACGRNKIGFFSEIFSNVYAKFVALQQEEDELLAIPCFLRKGSLSSHGAELDNDTPQGRKQIAFSVLAVASFNNCRSARNAVARVACSLTMQPKGSTDCLIKVS
ncbi:hypothetical protein C5167_000829 [Papaver somniferum]|uniref:Uncharacterized protein n=1 Tax=Papaver somniferum TaxID=3469 RepID=A0A4Y7KXQ1_PAPSO|nr:hypothetical protein C5167_000829 [Papaver somniferum]